MSEASTTIAYVGKKVEDGTMDARDLGPALLAIGKVCERAHEVINKDSKGIAVLVKKINTGSFEIDLSVTASLIEQTKNLFGVSDYKSADDILNTLGLGKEWFVKGLSEQLGKRTADAIAAGVAGVGGVSIWTLIKLMKFLKNRKPSEVTIKEDDVKMMVGSQPTTVPKDLWKLYNDKKTRNYLSDIVSPLEQEGMDALEIRDKKQKTTAEKITKEEIPYFMGDQKESVVEESKSKVLLQVDTTHMTDPEKRRWIFSSIGKGSRVSFSASIMDKTYMDRIKRGEILFKHGVRIRATLITRQITQGNKERNEYELHDIEHDPQGLLQKEMFKKDK